LSETIADLGRWARMDLTENHDLRGGSPAWLEGLGAPPPSDPLPTGTVDVAIIGAGIVGAMIAERLSADGMRVALVDRRPPARGSTAASTALVLWEMDMPLTHLAREHGAPDAIRRWQRVHAAVSRLGERIATDFDHDWMEEVPSVYLDGDLLDADGLRAEAEMRAGAGLPSRFLDGRAVADRFGLTARPAVLSDGGFTVDPVRLALGLLDRAKAKGATISYPVDVSGLSEDGDSIWLSTDRGEVRARHAVIAGGYERARWFLPPAFSLLSSYALATAPGVAPLWRENAMIWEASESYLYARTDAEGRVIAGGGDEDFIDARHRDALIPEKTEEIAASLGKLIGDPVEPRHRWAAMFGASPDGLPAIGPAANMQRLWLANGFGGNGVSFAALAAELIAAALVDGQPDPDADAFDPYRFGSAGS
jgi:glycine/D-amino acid oxidase-like deaminating enzyme